MKVVDIGSQEPTPEFWASQTFESLANIVKLDDMPTNDEAAKRGVNDVIWMRACAVILQDSDEELFAKMKDDESTEVFLSLLENLQSFIQSQKAGMEILEAAQTRLLVCLTRYETSMEGDAS